LSVEGPIGEVEEEEEEVEGGEMKVDNAGAVSDDVDDSTASVNVSADKETTHEEEDDDEVSEETEDGERRAEAVVLAMPLLAADPCDDARLHMAACCAMRRSRSNS
jgi:hypothetical protein